MAAHFRPTYTPWRRRAPALGTCALHRACGATTQAVERSHVPTRDRLRNSRGLKATRTGQRFLDGFEAVRHLRQGGAPGAGHLVRGQAVHACVREVVTLI